MAGTNYKKLSDEKLVGLAALYKDCADNACDLDLEGHFNSMYTKVRLEQNCRRKEKAAKGSG